MAHVLTDSTTQRFAEMDLTTTTPIPDLVVPTSFIMATPTQQQQQQATAEVPSEMVTGAAATSVARYNNVYDGLSYYHTPTSTATTSTVTAGVVAPVPSCLGSLPIQDAATRFGVTPYTTFEPMEFEGATTAYYQIAPPNTPTMTYTQLGTTSPTSTLTTSNVTTVTTSGVAPASKRGKNKKRQHVCPLCQRNFRRAHNLKIHQRVHTGEAPFNCPFNQCGKAFKWKSSIMSHCKWHARQGDQLPEGAKLPFRPGVGSNGRSKPIEKARARSRVKMARRSKSRATCANDEQVSRLPSLRLTPTMYSADGKKDEDKAVTASHEDAWSSVATNTSSGQESFARAHPRTTSISGCSNVSPLAQLAHHYDYLNNKHSIAATTSAMTTETTVAPDIPYQPSYASNDTSAAQGLLSHGETRAENMEVENNGTHGYSTWLNCVSPTTEPLHVSTLASYPAHTLTTCTTDHGNDNTQEQRASNSCDDNDNTHTSTLTYPSCTTANRCDVPRLSSDDATHTSALAYSSYIAHITNPSDIPHLSTDDVTRTSNPVYPDVYNVPTDFSYPPHPIAHITNATMDDVTPTSNRAHPHNSPSDATRTTSFSRQPPPTTRTTSPPLPSASTINDDDVTRAADLAYPPYLTAALASSATQC